MSLQAQFVQTTFKGLLHVLCKLDADQLKQVPQKGPLLVAVNHVNFLDLPVMHTHLYPRPITGFVKADHWEKPIPRWLFETWNAIPLQRGEADMAAIRRGLEALEQGQILGIAPEGTRTGDGRLQKAHPGIVIMALKSGAPILPVAYWGGEVFWDNFPRLRRTDFHVGVGRPFRLNASGKRVNREMRQQMADAIMCQIAQLLPPPYRGYYADQPVVETYLDFVPIKEL